MGRSFFGRFVYLSDPSKEVVDYFEANAKGVYKIRYKLANGQVKLSTMFPDSKSEIGVAKSLEFVYNANIGSPYTKLGLGSRRFIKGKDSIGVDIEIEIDINDDVLSGYPIFN